MNCKERVYLLIQSIEKNKWYKTCEIMNLGFSHNGVRKLARCGWLKSKGKHNTIRYKLDIDDFITVCRYCGSVYRIEYEAKKIRKCDGDG
jgi:hypothetical protein